MTILFVQLAVNDPSRVSQAGNVPLAGASLAAAAKSRAEFASVEFAFLPDALADHGSASAVVAHIAKASPDAVGFSLYLWNIEASLEIARRLKARGFPGTLFAGGPEVAEGSDIVTKTEFDTLVRGEGELPFLEFLDDLALGKPRPSYDSRKRVSFGNFPNPYDTGILTVRKGKAMFLESVRGCQNNCAYCFYGKAYDQPTLKGIDETARTFAAAIKNGATDIYLMDPEFNSRGDSLSLLARIAESNETGATLHAEVRLEKIDGQYAAQMARAGIVSVEAGLQSTNPAALKAVHRTFDKKAFERGANLLRTAGIEVKTGLILGLPFDRAGYVEKTIDFVEKLGLGPGAELYPLSLLPGTELRERAAQYGIEYMPLPPYWATETKWLPHDDFFRAFAYFESACGVEASEPETPWYSDPDPTLTGFIDARKPGSLERFSAAPELLANAVTVLSASDHASLARLAEAGGIMSRNDPGTIWRIVIKCDNALPERGLALAARDAFHSENHYHDRARTFNFEFQTGFQARLFYLSSSPRILDELFAIEEPWFDPVILPTEEIVMGRPDLFDSLSAIALKPSLLTFDTLRRFVSTYAGYENLVHDAENI